MRLSTDAKEAGQDVAHERLFTPGYRCKHRRLVYIYYSSEEETPLEVYFDDFSVEHVKSSVVQMDDYYPFGLAFNSYSRENSVPSDYKFNNKEEQTELNLGWLDFGARMYQPEIGRFFTQDRFAEKYYGLNPYQYAANNPINYIDVNGDSITVNVTQGAGKNGRDLYEVKVTGKVVDDTKNGLSDKQLNRIAKKLTRQIEKSFSGKDSNIEVKATAEISVADAANNPLAAGDHAFRVVDDVATTIGQTDPPGGNIEGFGPVGQNVVYLEKGGNYRRTGAHELGHSAGLGHPKDEINPATGAKYTTNDFRGNLMHQSQDRNSSGQPVAGTKVETWQVKKIERLYGVGALNRGRQK